MTAGVTVPIEALATLFLHAKNTRARIAAGNSRSWVWLALCVRCVRCDGFFPSEP